MPEMPALGGYWSETAGAVGASSSGTIVTSGGSTNAKGSVIELISATTHDAHWISVTIAVDASSVTGLLDIMVGSATEQVLIADLPVSSRGTDQGGGGPYLFPIFIPRGTRISARFQGSSASTDAEVVINLFSGHPASPWAGCSTVTRYGDTTTSRGTLVDPGGTANTYLANPVEIAASTTFDHRWIVLCTQSSDAGISVAAQWTVQLFIGSATEQQIGGDFFLSAGTTSDNVFPFSHWYLPIFVPSGSRLSVNAKCTSASAGDRALNLSIFGAG